MAALDFPALPAVNQQFPVTPIAGLPQYTWDGEKWTTVGAQISNAVPASALPLMDATPAVVGVTTKYAREDHIHPTDTTRADVNAVLLKVPQGLSTTEQTDIRKNVYAAPFDALAYSGMQVNGGCEIDQPNAGNINPANTESRTLDGWLVTGVGAVNVLSSADTALGLPPGFTKYVRIYNVSAIASLATGDLGSISTRIEGYRCARLMWGTASAMPLTIGFWVYNTSASGAITVAVQNSAFNRSYLTDVTTVQSTWSYRTITVPGCTDGTWNSTNAEGMRIVFCVGAGSAYRGAANTWVAANVNATTATGNLMAAANNQVAVTGVTILPGIEAPSAARSPFIMRPFDQELTICKRYWQKSYEYPVKPGTANSLSYVSFGGAIWTHYMGGSVIYPVEMRAAPTFNTYDYAGTIAKVTVVDIAGANTNNATQSGAAATTKLCYILMYGTGGVGQPSQVIAHWTADARL